MKVVTDKQYFITIEGEKVEVSKEVYQVYYQGHNKEDDFAKSDIRNDVFYYSGLDSDEFSGEDILVDENALPVDEQIVLNEDVATLKKALELLDEDERVLISSLYYKDMSYREFSRETGVPVMTLHYQHTKILKKLKSFFE